MDLYDLKLRIIRNISFLESDIEAEKEQREICSIPRVYTNINIPEKYFNSETILNAPAPDFE